VGIEPTWPALKHRSSSYDDVEESNPHDTPVSDCPPEQCSRPSLLFTFATVPSILFNESHGPSESVSLHHLTPLYPVSVSVVRQI